MNLTPFVAVSSLYIIDVLPWGSCTSDDVSTSGVVVSYHILHISSKKHESTSASLCTPAARMTSERVCISRSQAERADGREQG